VRDTFTTRGKRYVGLLLARKSGKFQKILNGKEQATPMTAFENLVDVVRKLRVECPWDKQQTHESLRYALIEEAYEVVESIDDKNLEELRKELGDLLLHVVYHSTIAEDNREFTLPSVIENATEKLIRRHPHVFGNVKVSGPEEVKENWERIKLSEGRESIVEGVPRELPALLRAFRVQEKASKVGFDWEKKEDVWNKVEEEVAELHAEAVRGDHTRTEEEFGDLLFAIVNYARFLHVNPEYALRRTVDKFIERFQYIESKLKEQGKDITKTSLEEMDKLWAEAKKSEP